MGRDALLFLVRANAQPINRKIFQNRVDAINYGCTYIEFWRSRLLFRYKFVLFLRALRRLCDLRNKGK